MTNTLPRFSPACTFLPGREGVKATFSETPEKSVGLEVEGCAFAIGVRPGFGPPSDVETAVIVVSDGVGQVGIRKKDGRAGFGVDRNGECCSWGQVIVVLVKAERFAVVGGVAAAMER